jgi:hypothetical protein
MRREEDKGLIPEAQFLPDARCASRTPSKGAKNEPINKSCPAIDRRDVGFHNGSSLSGDGGHSGRCPFYYDLTMQFLAVVFSETAL